MSVDTNTRSLLELVEAYRARECEAILGTARAKSAALTRSAHAEALATARRTFAEARERRAARIDAAKAEVATRRRIAQQHRLSALLAEGVAMLPAALCQRWEHPDQRAEWVRHLVAQAREHLPPSTWQIRHAPGWPGHERELLAVTLDSPPVFIEDAAHRAGLSIASPPNVIDGTLEGLLLDRAEIDAQLLVEMQRAAKRQPGAETIA